MTILEIYEALQVELNKVEAPTILVEDFNYFLKKAISQTIEEVYSLFESNQMTTDSLQGLIKTSEFYPESAADLTLTFPSDYLHLLSVTVENKKLDNCKRVNNFVEARKLPYNLQNIYNNAYFKPSINRPYFQAQGNELNIINGGNEVVAVYINYLSRITFNKLTQNDIESAEDATSELPINEFLTLQVIGKMTQLLLENVSDARIQTFGAVNQ